MAKSYYEKLKDPRWQKIRLQVMQRADFTCEMCGAKEKTLHAHHGYYARGHEPWEYPLDTLHCLCEDCHDHCGEYLHDVHLEIARLPIDGLREAFAAIQKVRDEFPRTYQPCMPGWWDGFGE